MSNILEWRLLKTFVHILQQRNLYITFIVIILLLYSVIYPLLLFVVILIILTYHKELLYKLIVLCLFIFLIGYGVLSSNIKTKEFNHDTFLIVNKSKQMYTYQYVLKNGVFKYIYYDNDEYSIGSKLTIHATSNPFHRQTIPKGFDPKNYYLGKGIIAELSNVTIIHVEHKETIREWVFNLKETYTNSTLEPFVDAFMFDDQKIIRTFTFDWLLYIFSVSGLHFFVLSQLIIRMFNIRNPKHHTLIHLGIMFPFFILQPFHFVIVRMILMNIGLLMFFRIRLKIPKYLILAIIWVMILMFEPYRIYDIGLIISFFILMNLYMSLHLPTNGLIDRYYVIFLASIIMSFFHGKFMILPMIIMPLIIIIVVFMIFLPTLLMFIFQIEIELMTKWFYKMLEVFQIMDNYVAIIQLPLPSEFMISIGFIGIFIIHLSTSKKMIMKKLFMLSLFMVLIGKIIVFASVPSLIFLDVGQGDATIYMDAQCVVVIDAFSEVESYLRSHGRQHIDYLFLTHSDLDHIKEAKNLVKNLNVKQVITSPFQDIEGIHTSTIFKFPTRYYCGDIIMDIIGPSQSMLNDNDDSLLILIDFQGKKILLTGDASKEREHEIISLLPPKIDVLKIGHHGSNTSTSKELLYAVQPTFGIISTSKNNRYGMPHDEVLENLDAFGVNYFITSLDGSIKLTIHEGEMKWTTYPP